MSECTCRMDGSFMLNCPKHGERNSLIHDLEYKLHRMTLPRLRKVERAVEFYDDALRERNEAEARVAVFAAGLRDAQEAAELLLDVIDDPVIATEPLRTIRVYSDRVKRARALLGKGQPGE